MTDQERLEALKDQHLELKSDAGRYWQYCDETQEALCSITTEIERLETKLGITAEKSLPYDPFDEIPF